MMENPIVTLSKLMQRNFGANIETRVVGKKGADHCPTIEVEIELPIDSGKVFTGCGSNQKLAKQAAAEEALKWWEEQPF
jgi:dsRNA-specific ribonuclease